MKMGQATNMLVNLLNIITLHIYYSFIKLSDDPRHNKHFHHHHRHRDVDDVNTFPPLQPGAPPPPPHLLPWTVVPLPAVQGVAESVKKQLPVVQYKKGKGAEAEAEAGAEAEAEAEADDVDMTCIVCMNKMKGLERMRELRNCSHAFHQDCLDGWIDEGHQTCPLCRSNLLPPSSTTHHDHLNSSIHHSQQQLGGPDPWRAERMLYLFGHDHYFIT